LTVSIFVCGYVIGPLILAPLSEIYGRRVVLTGANVFFCVWQIGCALAPVSHAVGAFFPILHFSRVDYSLKVKSS
jgi:MFS family permease